MCEQGYIYPAKGLDALTPVFHLALNVVAHQLFTSHYGMQISTTKRLAINLFSVCDFFLKIKISQLSDSVL